MTAIDREALIDRAAGALMGAFIGDALALGPHWYYDLDELRRHTSRMDWLVYRPGPLIGVPSSNGSSSSSRR